MNSSRLLTAFLLLCGLAAAAETLHVPALPDAGWASLPALQSGPPPTGHAAMVRPESIRLARQGDDLVIRLEKVNHADFGKPEVTVMTERYFDLESALLLHFAGEDFEAVEYKIDLRQAFAAPQEITPQAALAAEDVLELRLPLAPFGRGPLEFQAAVQTLFLAQAGMVGREASVRYPETGNYLLEIAGMPMLESSAAIADVAPESSPGSLTVRWENSLKSRSRVTLRDRDGQVVASRDNGRYARTCRADFTGIAPGVYRAEIQVTALNGSTAEAVTGDIAVAAPETAAGDDHWLRVQGKYIVDASGTPFKLVGMARCQYHDDGEESIHGPLEVQLAHYKSLGMNSIRLAIFPNREYDPAADYYQLGWDEFIDRYVDPEVQKIIDAGMYVILDSHHIAGTIEEAYERIPLWEALARRYHDEPKVAVYELWNESYLLPTGLSPESAPALRQWFKDCIAAIRQYDRRHIVMVSDWNAGWGDATPSMWGPEEFILDEPYRQVIFSRHMAQDHCNPAFVANCLDRVADQWNVPLLIGELELEPDLQTAEDLRRLLELLSANPNRYGVWLWRPHPDQAIFADIWSPWAKEYASPVPFEAKPSTVRQFPSDLPPVAVTEFPEPMAGGAFTADFPVYGFSVIELDREMPPGKYRFRTEYLTPEENAPALGLYYIDGDRQVHFAMLRGTPGESAVQDIPFFVKEGFRQLVIKKMDDAAQPSTRLLRLDIIPETYLER